MNRKAAIQLKKLRARIIRAQGNRHQTMYVNTYHEEAAVRNEIESQLTMMTPDSLKEGAVHWRERANFQKDLFRDPNNFVAEKAQLKRILERREKCETLPGRLRKLAACEQHQKFCTRYRIFDDIAY